VLSFLLTWKRYLIDEQNLFVHYSRNQTVFRMVFLGRYTIFSLKDHERGLTKTKTTTITIYYTEVEIFYLSSTFSPKLK